jgi:hypothetical protein
MINRAEPRACGHSRGPIPLDSEPEAERNAGFASNAAGDGCGRAPSDQAGRQPYRGELAVRNGKRGRGKRGQDLMAICHDARKGRYSGSHWSKPVAPPLHSTSFEAEHAVLIGPQDNSTSQRVAVNVRLQGVSHVLGRHCSLPKPAPPRTVQNRRKQVVR